MINPIKLLNRFFQARTEKPIVFVPPMAGTLGTVSHTPDKDGFYKAGFIPLPGAFGRCVRLHEADHLSYATPSAHRRRFITEATKAGLTADNIFHADQGLEDAHIGTIPAWRVRPKAVRRDAAAVALRELRKTVRIHKPIIQDKGLPEAVRDASRAMLFNCSLRSVAILNSTASELSERGRKEANTLQRLASALVSLPGPGSGDRLIFNIALLMRDGRHAPARAMTIAALAPTPRPALELPPFEDPAKAEPDFECEEHEIDGRHGETGSQVPIYLIKPALTAPCISGAENTPIDDVGSSGYRIARRALCAVGMGLPVASPFIRRNIPTPGGCIIFDASGSMGIDADGLRRVCKAAPAATVVYYSGGEDNNDRHGGFIVIYAKDGMRLDDSVPLPNLYNGNVADEQAIRFGLKEIADQGSDKPLIFVSDLGFCGNSEASKQTALRLIQDGQRNGTIEVIDSIDIALARFEGGHYNADND